MPVYFFLDSTSRADIVVSFLPLKIVVHSLSCVQLSVTPWTAARQASLSSLSLLELLSIESVGEAIQPSHPLSPPSLLALNLPSIRVFSKDSGLFQ